MITQPELTAYLDTYLGNASASDNSWNGLQITGAADVSTVAVAVDAGLATFAAAAEQQAEYLIVHHGLFWKFDNPALVGWREKRIQFLREHHLSLYATHLPLDRHPEVGNNAQLLRLLGAKRVDDFLVRDGVSLSGIGEVPTPLSLADIEEKLTEELGAVCTTLPFGTKTVRRIAVASGHGGYSGFFAALTANVDVYITGDTCEVYQVAKDAGMNVIFAGHYATETLGVKALAQHVANQLGLATNFIDMPTGL